MFAEGFAIDDAFRHIGMAVLAGGRDTCGEEGNSVTRRCNACYSKGLWNGGGFTLIEILAALSIMGVATFLFISLFTSSLELAQASRNLKVAADLADSQLHDLAHNAGGYVWPDVEDVQGGELVRVRPEGTQSRAAVPHPSAMPLDPAAHRRETNFYQKFSWDAYARLPRPQSPYVEVTVVVRWADRGRDRVFALASCMPRAVIGGAP